MAVIVSDDFSGYSIGAFPAGYTVSWDISGTPGSWAVRDDSGQRAFDREGASTNGDRAVLVDATAGMGTMTVTLRTKQVDANASGTRSGIAFMASGSGATTNGYYVALSKSVAGSGSGDQLVLVRIDNGAATLLLTPAYASALQTYTWLKVERQGSSIKVRAWADGDPEPGTWLVDTTDATHTTGGAGFFCRNGGRVFRYDDFTVLDTAGDPIEETAEGIALLLGDAEDTMGTGVVVEHAEGIALLLGDATDLAGSPVEETAEGIQLLLGDAGDNTGPAETAEGIQLLLGDAEDAVTLNIRLNAELPALEATIHQGALFSAELPALHAVFRAIAGPIATLDALLPALEATIYTAHKINATLPALQARLSAETDQPLSLDAELPALEADFNLWVDISPTLDAELPALEASFVTAHKFAATLPALQAALSLPVSGVISLSAALPSLYFDASVVTSGTATLDATLPALEARSILLGLVAELPALTARISSSTLVETLTKTAYALNTETGALTDFANFQFLKLGTLNGKLYGLTSAGRLVRLEGDTDDGEPILGYLLTHSDDRIYNDIGELVRTDYLRRCYGVYLKSRNLQGVQVELINDELHKLTYPVMPQMRAGLVNYRVDTYRGIMSHYWALGLRTQGGRFDLFSAALILESLDRKVW